MTGEQLVDPYKLLRVLEDVATRHAKTVRSLSRALSRLHKNPYDEELQSLVMTYLKRLRVLRARLQGVLNGAIKLEDVAPEIRDNIATLSEYMIIVGAEYEREVLRKAMYLSRKGAHLLEREYENLREDVKQVDSIVSKLQEIVDKYY